jgi:hypothetical protein
MYRSSVIRASATPTIHTIHAVSQDRLATTILSTYAAHEAFEQDRAHYKTVGYLQHLSPRQLSLAEIIVALAFLKTATKRSLRELLSRLGYHRRDDCDMENRIYGDEKETDEVRSVSKLIAIVTDCDRRS